MNPTAFITGGNGNLGSLLADALLARGTAVVRFDLAGSTRSQTRKDEVIVEGDIRDRQQLKDLLREHQPHCVYHLASLLSGSSEDDIEVAWDINVNASFDLLNLAVDLAVPRFFFASTAATYGHVDAEPAPNDYAQWPSNMYGVCKVAVERLGVYLKLKHGLDFRCLRYPMVFSPFAPPSAVTAYPARAFRAAIERESFTFPVSPDTGVSTLFLEDVINSMLQYVDHPSDTLTQHVYNVHAFYVTAAMLAETIKVHCPNFEYDFEPLPVVDQLISGWPNEFDDSDARRDWNWTPQFDLARAAQRMFELMND